MRKKVEKIREESENKNTANNGVLPQPEESSLSNTDNIKKGS